MDEKEVSLTTTAGDFYDKALKKRVKDDEKVTIAPFALGFEKAPSFCLVDAKSGEEVFRGKAQFVHNGLENDGRGNHSAENVYYLDFNQFNKPGRYYISVDGVGRSPAPVPVSRPALPPTAPSSTSVTSRSLRSPVRNRSTSSCL